MRTIAWWLATTAALGPGCTVRHEYLVDRAVWQKVQAPAQREPGGADIVHIGETRIKVEYVPGRYYLVYVGDSRVPEEVGFEEAGVQRFSSVEVIERAARIAYNRRRAFLAHEAVASPADTWLYVRAADARTLAAETDGRTLRVEVTRGRPFFAAGVGLIVAGLVAMTVSLGMFGFCGQDEVGCTIGWTLAPIGAIFTGAGVGATLYDAAYRPERVAPDQPGWIYIRPDSPSNGALPGVRGASVSFRF